MPRVVKHPELRRQEILDCAQSLFLARGYDNASLNEVIAAVGLSKGAFYHYFASKEALLEALADRLARAALAQLADILADRSLDALTRLNAIMTRSRQSKIENAATQWALFESLFRPENLVLFHRINAAAGALFTPVFARIVAQGVKEGTFRTFDPEGVADMILQLGGATRDIVARALAAGARAPGGAAEMNRAIRALERRIRLYEIALDRILGLPDGSVRLTERGYVRAVMSARLAGGAATKQPAPAKAAPTRKRRSR